MTSVRNPRADTRMWMCDGRPLYGGGKWLSNRYAPVREDEKTVARYRSAYSPSGPASQSSILARPIGLHVRAERTTPDSTYPVPTFERTGAFGS